jgi:hypothetical protein
MSFIGRLLGSDKALEATVDSVSKGLDALVYTDEERAAEASKDRSEARAMIVQWMAATQGQNLARRVISLAITGAWLGMYLLSVMCGMASVFVNSTGVVTSSKVAAVGVVASGSAAEMNSAVMLILAFYFAAPHMGDIAKAVTGKFTSSVNKG